MKTHALNYQAAKWFAFLCKKRIAHTKGEHRASTTPALPLMRNTLIGMFLALGTAVSAAADLAVSPAITMPETPLPISNPTTWTGFYVGAHLGSDSRRLASTADRQEVVVTTNRSQQFTGLNNWLGLWPAKGFVGGLHTGYLTQMNAFVVGVEASMNVSSNSGTIDSAFAGFIRSSMPLSGSLRARVGYAIGPALIYATGGLALANINNSYTTATETRKHSGAYTGWTVGAGADYRVNDHWSVRLDYSFTHYERFKLSRVTDDGLDYANKNMTHALNVGVSYRF